MALPDKTLPVTVSVLLMLFMVHGFTSDLLEKVRIANAWSNHHIHDKDVSDAKENLKLYGTDNPTLAPPASSAVPYYRNPSPKVLTKVFLQVPYSSARNNRKRRHLNNHGLPCSSTKCSKNSHMIGNEHSSHNDPESEPEALLKPTSPSSLPSIRFSDQQSTPSLPKPDTLSNHPPPLIPAGVAFPLPPEDKVILDNLETTDLDNTATLNDEESVDLDGEESSDSLNVLAFNASVVDPLKYPETFLRSLCPSQFCRNRTDWKTPEDTCCLPCYCTNECNSNGNCCEENSFFTNTSQPDSSTREVCTNPALLLRHDRRYTQSYMMVSLCSPLFTDLSVVTKCEQTDELTMDSLTPIYHPETGLTYRNVFCAICNFATGSYARWVPKLSCRQIFSTFDIFGFFNDYSDVLQNAKNASTCDVIWDPIDIPNKSCFKRQDLVSNCLFDVSPTIYALCEQDEFIAPIVYEGIGYKNMFCLNCTLGVPIHQDMCINSDPMKDHNVEVILNTDALDSDLAIDETLAETQNVANDICKAGFEIDKDFSTCVRLSCSVSKVYVKGVCQPVFDTAKGIGLQFHLSLLYQVIPPKQDVLIDIHKILPDKLAICEETISYHLTANFTLTVTYWATTVSASFVSIQEMYSEFEQKINAQKKGDFTVEIGGTGYLLMTIDVLNYVPYALPGYFTQVCPSSMVMAKIQFCDTVLVDLSFSRYEYDDDHLVINGFEFKPFEYLIRSTASSPGYAQICQDALQRHDISLRNLIFNENGDTPVQTPASESSSAPGVHAGIWNVAAMYLLVMLIN